jgi:hypothetical protein
LGDTSVVTRVVLLVLLAGCRQLLGFESVGGSDAARPDDGPTDAPVDTMVEIDGPPVPVTVVFQHGDAGYSSGHDTYIKSGDGTPNNGESQIRWGKDDTFGLIRFDDIFGSASDQIPPGAIIVSAMLVLDIESVTADGELRDSAVEWTDTVVFDDFGGDVGVDATEIGDLATALPQTTGSGIELDVTPSLQRWVLAPATNRGWIFASTASAQEGRCRSNDDGVLAQHPLLKVTYTP